MSLIKRNWHYIFYSLLCLLLIFFLATPIRMTAVDLGRHIANGREIFSGNTNVLFQNHYSYSMETQKFTNHHWLFGILVFILEQIVGFAGIHIFNIFVLIMTLLILLKLIEKNGNPAIASLLGILAVMFFATRPEIRPETVGLLFVANSLLQISNIIATKKISRLQMIFLLLQQLLWTNTHITFIFGIFLIGLLWFSSYILHSPKLNSTTNKKLLLLTTLLPLISIINPNLIQGVLEPFNIFVDYGYSIVENQTLLFLWKVIAHPTFFQYLFFMSFAVPIFFWSFSRLSWFERILFVVGSIMGYLALRNIPIFALFTFPITAKGSLLFLKAVQKKHALSFSNKSIVLLFSQLYFLVSIIFLSGLNPQRATIINRKIGIIPEEQEAAKFIKNNNISGPIFNNYDIGSYLIYHLYPSQKVFVDNRPEAYSKDFLQNTYIKMQQDSKKWNEVVEKNQIKTVIFGIQDITPWAQEFLHFIEDQPHWNNIYRDPYASIWIKKNNTEPS